MFNVVSNTALNNVSLSDSTTHCGRHGDFTEGTVCPPVHLFLLQSIGHWTLEVWFLVNSAKINK